MFDTEGWVKDAETGKPVPEAVVTMDWPNAFGLMDNVEFATLVRREVVTDKNGHFVVPGWFKIWPLYKYWDEVYFGVHAAGYYSKRLSDRPRNPFIPLFWWSRWDGKTIELQPMHWREWTKEEWEKKGKDWGAAINYWRDCQWLKFPLNVVENIKYRIRKREMIRPNLDVCGDGMEYLRDARDQCGVDAFSLLKHYGLTKEEWEICLTGKGRRFRPDGKGK